MTRSRHLVLVVLVGAIFCLATSVRVGAQTSTPEPNPRISQEVIVTATVGDAPADAVSQTVTVITRAYLEQIGITSLVEGLRLAPGLDPRARGPRDVQTDFSIRGSTFGQNLILADGIRLNDSQSGHHNGEIPMPLEGVDRIEVVYGPGSAVHGADALGGTVNIVSRRGAYAGMRAEFGQFGYASAQGLVSGNVLPAGWSLTGWGSRSRGFMTDRDFALGGVALRGSPVPGLTLDVRHQRRAFGANGFYGPSPSKEWTDLTLAAVSWQHTASAWTTTVKGAVRDHHDHFRWDIARPGFAENRHRTNAGEINATLQRELGRGRRVTGGLAAGQDWIVSSNLSDHEYTRTSAFGELLLPVGSRAVAQAGLRADNYSNFGLSVSPSFSTAVQAHPDFRLRAATGRAFRIPTFTELYYSDPSNLGSPDLRAERGWFVDGGADWTHQAWTVSVTPFRRWDEDVIDWLRASEAEKWQSTNVRDVTSTGFETSITRRWPRALLRLHYAGLKVDAPALTLQSKYVLEYARHQSGGSLSVPIGQRLRVAFNVDHRHRVDGQSYDLVALRISHTLPRGELFLDGSNLLDETYHEITGVAMPGRWITAGFALR